MNLGTISTAACINVLPSVDDRCDDAAFSIANPSSCPQTPRLIIKPGVSLICQLGSVNFRAFRVENGIETDVTDGAVWQSSDGTVALIGATTGSATGVDAGSVNISAAYQAMTAQAELTVLLGTDCCDDITVAMMVLVDQSRSMSQSFPGYSTKLGYAKLAATTFIDSVNESKDLIGLARFTSEAAVVLSAPVSDKATVSGLVAGILQTQDDTSFFDGMSAAIDALNAVTADRKVLVLISDGEDTTSSYIQFPNPIVLADDFKMAGGIVLSLGVRAHGAGYSLLSALSTGGFFLNAYDGTDETSLDFLVALKGYLCGGSCGQEGDTTENTGQLRYSGMEHWRLANQFNPGLQPDWADVEDDDAGAQVDLLGNGFFDYLPGNGLYISLMGDQNADETPNPHLASRDFLTLVDGHQYRFSMKVAGNQVQADGTASVLWHLLSGDGAEIVGGVIAVPDYQQGFHVVGSTFTAADPDSTVKIVIYQNASDCLTYQFPPNATLGNCAGILLNEVKLEDLTTGDVIFFDDFDENAVYVPPKCGYGTVLQPIGVAASTLELTGAGSADVNGTYSKTSDTRWDQVGGAGYTIQFIAEHNAWELWDPLAVPHPLYITAPEDFPNGWITDFGDPDPPTGEITDYDVAYGYIYGYDCYGDGCLDTPPPAQAQDPSPLPVLESNPAPPAQVFSATKTACAECLKTFVHTGEELAATTLSAGEVYETTIQLTGVAAAIKRWQVTFNREWQLDPTEPPQFIPDRLILEGSNDQSDWTELDSNLNAYGPAGQVLAYSLSSQSDAFKYYRASAGDTGIPPGSGKVLGLKVFAGTGSDTTSEKVCRTATAEGGSPGEAATKAMAAAQALADAALDCRFVHTATEVYTCQDGTSASATRTSQNSYEEAKQLAYEAAKEAAGCAEDA